MSRKDKLKRQCIVCKQFKDKSDLIRFTKDCKTQNIEINDNAQFYGRSAYVCNSAECIDISIKKQMIEKKLKAKFSQKTQEKISKKI